MSPRSEAPTTQRPGIDAPLLTEVLRRAGVLADARVARVDVEEVGAGRGYVGRVFRCHITYDRPVAAPATLIAKLPTGDDERRRLFERFGLYEREARFYRELRGDTPIPTADYRAAESGAETGSSLLLMDEVRGTQGDVLNGCTVAQARDALAHAARLHAAWWESRTLDALDWLPAANAPAIRDLVTDCYDAAWREYARKAGAFLPPAIERIGARLGSGLPEVLDALSERPRTLVHGDYQVANMFFDADDHVAAVIDWQMIIRARGAMDVAHLIVRSLRTEDRRAHEKALLREYCDELARSGVTAYPIEACVRDYRRAVLSQFGLGVVLAYALPSDGSGGVDNNLGALAAVVGRRLFAAMVDLDVEEFVGRRTWWSRALATRR